MDIMCRICGEPWEIDTFHDVAEDEGITFDEATRRFRADGCFATGWYSKPCEPSTDPQQRATNMIAGELMDLLGDDVDGAAAMLEDFRLI